MVRKKKCDVRDHGHCRELLHLNRSTQTAATMQQTSGAEGLNMNKGSCYGDANSNAMNSTSEKRLNEGDVNRRAMCEISLLDYVRRETNIKPIPKERSGLCYQHLVCYQENLSTNDIKKPRQRIKKRVAKVKFGRCLEKHKT